jgi:hypothetical protein
MLKSEGLRRGEICLNRDCSEEQENPVGNFKGGGKMGKRLRFASER